MNGDIIKLRTYSFQDIDIAGQIGVLELSIVSAQIDICKHMFWSHVHLCHVEWAALTSNSAVSLSL